MQVQVHKGSLLLKTYLKIVEGEKGGRGEERAGEGRRSWQWVLKSHVGHQQKRPGPDFFPGSESENRV